MYNNALPYSLHRGRHDKVLFWVELSGHDVLGVPCQYSDTLSGRAVPDAKTLVI